MFPGLSSEENADTKFFHDFFGSVIKRQIIICFLLMFESIAPIIKNGLRFLQIYFARILPENYSKIDVSECR